MEPKTYTLTISFEDGRTKEVTFIQGRMKLKTLRMIQHAQKSGEWDDLIPAIASMLRITPEEADEIEMADWQAMAEAMSGSTSVPNDGGPTPT